MRFRTSTRFRIRPGAFTFRLTLSFAVAVLAAVPAYGVVQSRHAHHPAAKRAVGQSATHHASGKSSGKSRASLRHASYSRSSRHHVSRHHAGPIGQRVMEPQRATEIQQALIQAHYLDGSATGQWDPATQAAMEKYQTDNGWQSKITPDSRALIKLGLGPKQDEGEYAATPASPASVSSLSGGGSNDPLRSMAASELPANTAQN